MVEKPPPGHLGVLRFELHADRSAAESERHERRRARTQERVEEGEPNVHCHLAPYYVNLACLPFGLWLAADPPAWPFHFWAAAVVLLLISPVADTLYNLLKWRLRGSGDFAAALDREE